jgi:uncharacterized protein YdeI (BOF family)
MKKQLLVAGLTALLSTAALAEGSLNGSKKIASGSLNFSTATVKAVITEASGSIASTADSLKSSAIASGDVSMYILDNPIDASTAASTYVVTTSGNILEFIGDSTVAFLRDPSGQIVASGQSVSNAVRVVIDASGNVLTASGNYLVDVSGEPVQLVLDGSGDVLVASKDVVVISATKTLDVAKSTAQKISAVGKFIIVDSAFDASLTAGKLGSASAKASLGSLQPLFDASAQIWNAATTEGLQYEQ